MFRGLLAVALRGMIGVGVLTLVLPLIWTEDPASESVLRAWAGFAVLLMEVFGFHGGLFLLAVGVAGLVSKRWVTAGVLLVLGGALSGPGLVRVVTPAAAPVALEGPTITVLSQNLLFSGADHDRLVELVEAERPDVIALQEVVTDGGEQLIERFADEYPHVAWPRTHEWGSLLLSRTPFVETPAAAPGDRAWPIEQPVGVVEVGGARVTVVGVHLPAPNHPELLQAGPRMADAFGAWLDRIDGPLVAIGDFNAPLWTARLGPLRRHVGLERAHDAAGGGRGATWPDRSPLRYLPGVRLDQAAFRGGLVCVDARVLPSVGSDHRPIMARFVVVESGGD